MLSVESVTFVTISRQVVQTLRGRFKLNSIGRQMAIEIN